MRAFLTAQRLQDSLVADALAAEGGVIDGHNTVAGQNTRPLRRSSGYHLNNHYGILLDVELDAYARKRAFELFLYV